MISKAHPKKNQPPEPWIADEFPRSTPYGLLTAVALPHFSAVPQSWWEELFPAELEFAQSLGERRVPTWIGGRRAVRKALRQAGSAWLGPILPDARRAPALPHGLCASISHKTSVAVALLDTAPEGSCVGVDLEGLVERRAHIARMVLTDKEMARWQDDPEMVLTIFSAKEAIYKALDPFVHRYVAFKEVELLAMEGDKMSFKTQLRAPEKPDGSSPQEGPFEVDVGRISLPGNVLTLARVSTSG